jgi:hypothetical protein
VKDAASIAALLDFQYNPEIQFADVEEFVRPRLGDFAKDLIAGNEPVIAEEGAPAEGPVAAPVAPEMTDEDAMMAAMLMGEDEDDDYGPLTKADPAMVASSYPRSEWIESFARANGYEAFIDAYDELGDGARYDVAREYTQVGLKAVSREAEKEVDDGVIA